MNALPIKTKFAAWWMLIVGAISLGGFLLGLILTIQRTSYGCSSISCAIGLGFSISLLKLFLLIGLSSLISYLFLFKKGSRKWNFSIISLLLGLMATIIFSLFLFVSILNDLSKSNTTISSSEIFGLIIYFLIIVGIPIIVLIIPLILLLSDRKNP